MLLIECSDFTIETNKTQNRDNPRPSFSEEEYKLFLKTTKECIEREDVVKGNLITLEHYYLIVFQVATFLEIHIQNYLDLDIKISLSIVK